MSDQSPKIELAYKLDEFRIDESFTPLLDAVTDAYHDHHPEAEHSLYAIGSIVYGGFRPTISDIDVIGISSQPIDKASDAQRKKAIFALSAHYPDVAYIDNVAVPKDALLMGDVGGASQLSGHLAKLALTGICFAGEEIDLSPYLPSRDDMIFGRVDRVRTLLTKYQSGDLIEPFKQDPRLLERSCAKAAMRVMSSIALQAGALYHPAPTQISLDIARLRPELSEQTDTILRVIDEPDTANGNGFELIKMALDTFTVYNEAYDS